jgi:hypothetical protein
MKREYVLPDLLATMTADALFAGKSQPSPAQPVGRKPGSFFSRWFSAAPARGTQVAGSPSLALDDDWVGGWYARTRLLQAATLARIAERKQVAAQAAPGNAEGGAPAVRVDVVTQMKDFS